MSDKKRQTGKKVDGQPRYIDKNETKSGKGTSNLYWLIPVIIVLLIVTVMIYHLGNGSGEEDTASEETTSEETADSGESEESSEEGASSGDVDAEGIARDNCASCHGQDFSGA